MLSKGSGLTSDQMPSVLPRLPGKMPLSGGIDGAAVNIIFLDVTWHEAEYWIQAKEAIRDLYPDLRGAVHLAPVGISRKVALISNKETFFTRTLPMLNQQAFNPNNQFCREIKYPQIRTVMSRINALESGAAECFVYFFTDTEIAPQSREFSCADITSMTEPKCVLKSMMGSFNCEIKSTFQFGTCNPNTRGLPARRN